MDSQPPHPPHRTNARGSPFRHWLPLNLHGVNKLPNRSVRRPSRLRDGGTDLHAQHLRGRASFCYAENVCDARCTLGGEFTWVSGAAGGDGAVGVLEVGSENQGERGGSLNKRDGKRSVVFLVSPISVSLIREILLIQRGSRDWHHQIHAPQSMFSKLGSRVRELRKTEVKVLVNARQCFSS
jgi:hypothetical protein